MSNKFTREQMRSILGLPAPDISRARSMFLKALICFFVALVGGSFWLVIDDLVRGVK